MKEYKYYKTIEYNNFYEMLNALYKKHSKKIAIKYSKRNDVIEITYNQLIKEGLNDEEITVIIEETNISVGSVKVIAPEMKIMKR